MRSACAFMARRRWRCVTRCVCLALRILRRARRECARHFYAQACAYACAFAVRVREGAPSTQQIWRPPYHASEPRSATPRGRTLIAVATRVEDA